MERTAINGGQTLVVEVTAGDFRYVIFSSLNPDLQVTHEDMAFLGRFGVICRDMESDAPVSLYLGHGAKISVGESILVTKDGQTGAYLEL